MHWDASSVIMVIIIIIVTVIIIDPTTVRSPLQNTQWFRNLLAMANVSPDDVLYSEHY